MIHKEKEAKDKRIFRLYRRYREIKQELTKKYPVHFSLFPLWYSLNGPVGDIDYFLQLRDEALRIEYLIHNKEYKRYVKYVRGGNTYFYTPIKKKERRKMLRKSKQLPIEHFVQIYEDEITPMQSKSIAPLSPFQEQEYNNQEPLDH